MDGRFLMLPRFHVSMTRRLRWAEHTAHSVWESTPQLRFRAGAESASIWTMRSAHCADDGATSATVLFAGRASLSGILISISRRAHAISRHDELRSAARSF